MFPECSLNVPVNHKQNKSKKGGEDEDDMFKMDGDDDDAEEDSSVFKMDDDDDDEDEDDELGDIDMSRLIIVTQWRSKPQAVRDHGGRSHGSRGVTEDLANVINDGLYYYEREVSIYPLPSSDWGRSVL